MNCGVEFSDKNLTRQNPSEQMKEVETIEHHLKILSITSWLHVPGQLTEYSQKDPLVLWMLIFHKFLFVSNHSCED